MSASREKKQRLSSGEALTQKELKERKEAEAAKRKTITYWIVGIVVVILVAALLIWDSGLIQRNMTAATIGGENLSVAEMQYYYNSARQSEIQQQQMYSQYGISILSDPYVMYDSSSALGDEQVYNTESGQTYALGALPRILWVKNKLPELYARVKTVSMFNDWLIYKLTGVLKTEPSNGCTTGIFDLQKRQWDAAIMRKVGLKDDIFPPVAECGEVVSRVSAKGAADTGLKEGTTVVAGGGDAQLGCIGVGVVDNGQAAVFGGSFWQYEFNTDSGKTDADCRVRVNCHAVPGLWQYEALAFKPGLVMRWYRDAFCQEEVRRARELGTDPYQLMNEQAAKVPAGSWGMMCAFSDVMNYIAWRHASPTFTNFDFDPEKFNKYTFYRAIMENTAMVTRGHLELVREATGNAPQEIVFAGGASKGDIWCQILADVLGLPVKVPVVKEATALGAAILAGYGVGVFTDISATARRLVKWDKTFLPDARNHEVYERMYGPWREMYRAQLKLADDRVTRFMWAAPGL